MGLQYSIGFLSCGQARAGRSGERSRSHGGFLARHLQPQSERRDTVRNPLYKSAIIFSILCLIVSAPIFLINGNSFYDSIKFSVIISFLLYTLLASLVAVFDISSLALMIFREDPKSFFTSLGIMIAAIIYFTFFLYVFLFPSSDFAFEFFLFSAILSLYLFLKY